MYAIFFYILQELENGLRQVELSFSFIANFYYKNLQYQWNYMYLFNIMKTTSLTVIPFHHIFSFSGNISVINNLLYFLLFYTIIVSFFPNINLNINPNLFTIIVVKI